MRPTSQAEASVEMHFVDEADKKRLEKALQQTQQELGEQKKLAATRLQQTIALRVSLRAALRSLAQERIAHADERRKREEVEEENEGLRDELAELKIQSAKDKRELATKDAQLLRWQKGDGVYKKDTDSDDDSPHIPPPSQAHYGR